MRDRLPDNHAFSENQVNDFKALLRYIDTLAKHKLGYPVSLLTYLGVIDNKVLGIQPGSLANILLNNVGDPFRDSETSLMEVKKQERELISILEKYYGMQKNQARGYVTTGGTEGNFAGLWWSKRYLINSALETLIKTDDKIKLQLKEEQELTSQLNKISINDYQNRAEQLQKLLNIKNEIINNKSIVQQLLTPTIFYTKQHTHYSVPKIAEILRLNIRTVESNIHGDMNLDNLKKELILHIGAYPYSPVIVIANIGTTITGAVDNVPEINNILKSLLFNVHYSIHMDGALTGFVMPILKPFGEVNNYFDDIGANTLAVSAHKYPGLSQPCGIILARRSFFEKAFEKSERNIDYVGNILDVTITGSRSGLNVLMFFNALYTLGLHEGKNKLTKMVEGNLQNATYLYEELIKIFGKDKVSYPYHFNVMFPKPSIALSKKYQLMLTGDKATICVLTNVSKILIDQFIEELKFDKEMTMTNTGFTIQSLQDVHINSAVDLFTKSFCESEPITKQLNISQKEYATFVYEVLQKAAQEGLSTVVLDKQNRVIACCLAEDITNMFRPNLARYSNLKPVFKLLDLLSQKFLKSKEFLKNKIAHVWIIAVAPEYRGQKVSVDVMKGCNDLLCNKGFDFAYAELTNPLSEKLVYHFKLFELINQINYSEFTLDNDKPFKNVPGAAKAFIISIRPGVKLETLTDYYRETEKV